MTTNGSHPTTECSHDPPKVISARDLVVQLRFEIDRLGWRVQELEAERAAVVEALLSTGVEPASGDPVQLVYQVRELVRELRAELIRLANALREIRVEAEGDRDWDIITTAARGALEGVEDE